MQQAYEMAVEALGLALIGRKEEGEEIPIPSEIGEIRNEDGTIVGIFCISFPYHVYMVLRIFTYVNGFYVFLRTILYDYIYSSPSRS